MPDPITAAAAAASKALSGAVAKKVLTPGVRLGSAEERRVVYARFTEVITRWLMLTLRLAALRRAPIWVVTPWARLPEQMFALQADVLIAYQELRLVASGPVLAGADDALERTTELLAVANDRKKPMAAYEELSSGLGASLREFTEICRADLAYVPRAWQVWRPAWWGVRWTALRGRRAARRELHAAGQRELTSG